MMVFEDDPPEGAPGRVRPKDAATLVLVRGEGAKLRFLMGRRSRGHAFMPDKFVFPGGRVDRTDALAPAAHELSAETEAKLREGNVRRRPRAFAMAAVRETFEETGLIVGKREHLHGAPPAGWAEFYRHHAAPDLSKLTFVARAVTPPHHPRRFDARFFMAHAEDVLLDDRPHRDNEELLEINWFTLDEIEHLDLPRVTRFVAGEVAKRVAGEHVEARFLRWRPSKTGRTRVHG